MKVQAELKNLKLLIKIDHAIERKGLNQIYTD